MMAGRQGGGRGGTDAVEALPLGAIEAVDEDALEELGVGPVQIALPTAQKVRTT